MERHDRETIEAARICFLSECGQDRGEVARRMNVSRRTVDYWARRDDWEGQFQRLQSPEGQSAARLAITRARLAMPAMVAELVKGMTEVAPLRDMFGKIVKDDQGEPVLVYANSYRDRAYAFRLLQEVAMKDLPAEPIDEVVAIEGVVIEGGPALDVEDYVAAAIQANVDAVNTRQNAGRKGTPRV